MTGTRPLRPWRGHALVAVGVVATLEGAVRGAGLLDAIVGGGAVAGLALLVGVTASLLVASARVLLPSHRRSTGLPAAIVVAVVVAIVVVVATAHVIAARHRDPAMIAVTVAVLGTIVTAAAIAVVVPLALGVGARLQPWLTTLPQPRWVQSSSRAAAFVAALWAVGGLARLAIAESPQLHGSLAVGASRVLVVVTDFDGDGTGLVGTPRDRAPFQPAPRKPRARR